MAVFDPVPSRVSFPEQEERILGFLQQHDIFKRSVEERPADIEPARPRHVRVLVPGSDRHPRDGVGRSLRDFLIEIRIAGYTPEEKVEIARSHLLPELVKEHGLTEDQVRVEEDALTFLTRGYARDAGLGNLRRALSAILRYVAHQKATGAAESWCSVCSTSRHRLLRRRRPASVTAF